MSEVAMPFGLPQSLRTLVTNKFTTARSSQSLIFSDTQLAILYSKANIPLQLRYCPALSKKPIDNKPSPSPSSVPNKASGPPNKKKFDPFENPSADLLVARIPDLDDHTHNLVLNKFPVIPNHFILATRENKAQIDLLDKADLGLTYACLIAWQHEHQHSLFAFFNSGEHSGASQPHRHLQFLPVEDMRGSTSPNTWSPLCNRMVSPVHASLPLVHDPTLPIMHLAVRLRPEISSSELHEYYLYLMRATALLLTYRDKSSGQIASILSPTNLDKAEIVKSTGQTTFSYNLALTTTTMAILPRRAEDAVISELATNSNGNGKLSINGTILAGTFMVKEETEWEILNRKPEIVDDLLRQIGFAKIDGAKI